MATACLSREDFSSGAAPRICPVTGQPSGNRWDLDAPPNPKAMGTFIFFGVVAWILARLVWTKGVVGTLWLSNEALEDMRRRRRMRTQVRNGVFVGAATLAMVAFLYPGPQGELVRPLMTAIALAGIVVGVLVRVEPLRATLDDTGRWVMVDDVHAAFAEAVAKIATHRQP